MQKKAKAICLLINTLHLCVNYIYVLFIIYCAMSSISQMKVIAIQY